MENKRRALGRGLEELFNIEDINYNKIEEKIMETANENEVMAVEHKKYNIYGVQFHPESILTIAGKQIINNFLGG